MSAEEKPRLRLYGSRDSSSTHRCRIAFHLKGMRYEFHPVDLGREEQKTAEYHAINPQGMVPAVVTSGGAHLGQSLAILEWLEERRPNPPLLARNANLRAKERGFAQVIACEIQPRHSLQLLDALSRDFAASQEQLAAWNARWITEGLEACEALLDRQEAKFDFCFGRTPGLADVCLVPQLHVARRSEVDISGFKRLCEIEERCNALKPFAKAHPDWREPAEA